MTNYYGWNKWERNISWQNYRNSLVLGQEVFSARINYLKKSDNRRSITRWSLFMYYLISYWRQWCLVWNCWYISATSFFLSSMCWKNYCFIVSVSSSRTFNRLLSCLKLIYLYKNYCQPKLLEEYLVHFSISDDMG